MKFYFEELIDKYNLGELSGQEIEMFYMSLEYNSQLKKEFSYFLKMKYFLSESNFKRLDEFLTSYRLKK